jgi:hypothetical protein
MPSVFFYASASRRKQAPSASLIFGNFCYLQQRSHGLQAKCEFCDYQFEEESSVVVQSLFSHVLRVAAAAVHLNLLSRREKLAGEDSSLWINNVQCPVPLRGGLGLAEIDLVH